MRPRGFSRAYVNPGLELFLNDGPLQLARWPNQGTAPLGEVLDPGAAPREGDASGRGGVFTYVGDRPGRWTRAEDLWVSGLFRYGFADDTLPVKAIDPSARTIALAQAHTYGLGGGQPWHAWYALNLLEEIDTPGEWYLDLRTGVLYLWPPARFEAGRLAVSLLDGPLVALEEASYVVFEDLTFEVSRGMGVYIEGGTGNRIVGCTFRNLGTVAVCMGQGARPRTGPLGSWERVLPAERGEPVAIEPVSREPGDLLQGLYADTAWDRRAGTNHGVVSCDIYNTGAGGVVLGGGDRRTLTPAGNYVENCHIHDFNRLDRAYRGAVNIDGVGNRVAHCLIHDAPHCAILLSGNDHRIEYNEVHHVCRLADDMGAFYMGRDPSQRGNVLRHNFWHHNGGGRGGATCTVYLDDGTCGQTVVGNVFYRNRGQTVWINGGHDNTFEGNLFVESGAGIAPGWEAPQWNEWVRSPLQTLRLRQAVDVTRPPYRDRYPGLAGILSDDPNLQRGNQVLRNVMVRSGEPGGGRNELQDNLVTADDPGFVDPARLDFSLRPDAVVFQRVPGFEAIPFRAIGLQRDRYRRSVPPREPGTRRSAPRDPSRREFACDFRSLEPGPLPEHGRWGTFGPGPDVHVAPGEPLGPSEPGLVAVGTGPDSWAVVPHGMVLSPRRDLVLELQARLPEPLPNDASFELYLNRGAVWDGPAFGPALVGGAEDGIPDSVGLRQGSAGPRVLATERMAAGHWYAVRMTVAAGQSTATLSLRDLTAGDADWRLLSFAEGPTARVTQGEAWSPTPGEIDCLVLRLGGGAQVRALRLTN
jgi:hypothetical protein